MSLQSMFNISRLLTALLCCLLAASAQAQQNATTVKGRVTDELGTPLAGVTIKTANGKNGTRTNNAGIYTLSLTDNAQMIIVSRYGYASQSLPVGRLETLDIRLKTDAHQKDELVQLGYSTQFKKEVSGAVATVSGEELERAPVANFTQTLAGHLPGLTTIESFSELSRATTDIYVRGLSSIRLNTPLVVIDGIPVSYNTSETLEYISANEIESVSVLKDASTEAIYGIQGANGVIVIKTRRGTKGPLQIKVRFDESVQQPTRHPSFFNAGEYATLRNQAAANDGNSTLPFTSDQVENFKSGTNRNLYPNNNWYDMFIRKLTTMQRASVNLTAGNDKVQFFSNINVMHQGGMFNTDQTKYNPNANDVWVNYRSNVDMIINKYLKTFVRLSGNIKRERTPGVSNSTVYASIFNMPATTYGPVTPLITDPNTGDVLDPGGRVLTTTNVTDPAYGLLNRSGYYRHTVTNITSQFGLDLDMSFLTKGLQLTGVFAYQTNSVGSLGTTQSFERYVRTGSTDTLAFTKKGDQTNTPLAYSKTSAYYYHLTYKTALDYQRDFGKHHLSAMAYTFYQNLTKSDVSSPALLPYNRISSGAEVAYGYDDRYFGKLDWGYSGSEQYARNSRYTSTPAVSLAWLASNEVFLKSYTWLSELKVRASYGKTANDQSGLARYAYLDNNTVTGGGQIAYLQYTINELQKGNPDIRAEVSTKRNLGIDIGLFNELTISADVFKEHMDNMVVSAVSNIPSYQGIPLSNYPSTNVGRFENKGYEINVNYRKQVNRSLSFNLGGMFSYAKNKVVNIAEATLSDDYVFKKRQEGYSVGQEWGYLVDHSNGNGYFNSQSELDNSGLSYSFGTPRLGDLKYRDLNKDGIIDDRDKAPIGNGSLPRVVYAFSAGLQYKSFELNGLFQGVSQFSTIMSGIGVFETSYDGVFGSLHRNAWTADRYAGGQKITAPALSLAKSVSHESNDFYNYNRRYLRLKNLELAYTLPASAAKAISAERIRVLLSGQNLLTWDKMKSKDFGPEGGGYASFPVYRVYNVGISVIF